MSNKIASLFIKVDSKQAKKGTDDLKKLGKQAAVSEKRALSLGKAFAGAFVVLAGAKFFSSAISNTIEQEKVVAQLEATLKSTGNYTKELSSELQDYAAQLQKVTTFGDEAILSSQSLLLTFRNIGGDVFPRAEEAVLDVATAMDIDLKSAVIQVGKALNDPVIGMTALSRSGITFTETQKDLVKGFVETNQLAKAQDVILTELEAQFGGSARAAKDTLGGAFKSLQNSMGDLLEGDTGSTKEVTSSLKDLADTLSDPEIKQGFQTLVTGVFSVTEQLVKGVSELIEFDHWLGVVGKKYLGIDFAERATDSFIRLNDEIAELQTDLNELEINGKGNSPGAFYIRAEIASASKELKTFTKQMQDDLKPSKSPVIDFEAASEGAVVANKSLEKTLKDAQKEAVKTADTFKKMYSDITKASSIDDADVTVLDIDGAQLQAQSLIQAGDFEGAIEKAKEGFSLIEQMKNAGNLSDELVAYYAEQLKDVGSKAGDELAVDAQINIDADLAKQKAQIAGTAMQETLTANPLTQIIQIQWSKGGQKGFDVPDSATQKASSQSSGAPTIIKFGNAESPPMYGDQQAVDEWKSEMSREANKRGKR